MLVDARQKIKTRQSIIFFAGISGALLLLPVILPTANQSQPEQINFSQWEYTEEKTPHTLEFWQERLRCEKKITFESRQNCDSAALRYLINELSKTQIREKLQSP